MQPIANSIHGSRPVLSDCLAATPKIAAAAIAADRTTRCGFKEEMRVNFSAALARLV
jgi:hypothetical protein